MHQLEKNLIDELNDNKKEILEREYPSDLIHEYADRWVPVYKQRSNRVHYQWIIHFQM